MACISGSPPGFTNILMGHNYIYSFIYFLWLLSFCRGRVEQLQSLSVGYITFTSVQYFGLGEDHSQLMVWYHLHKARQALSQFQHVVSTRETNLKSRIIERQFKSVEMAQPSVERGLCSYHIESNPKASFPISLQLSYTNFWKFLFSIPQHYL